MLRNRELVLVHEKRSHWSRLHKQRSRIRDFFYNVANNVHGFCELGQVQVYVSKR